MPAGPSERVLSHSNWRRKLPTPIERIAPFRQVEKPQDGIAMIFDLQGFSKFANQPDVHEFIPRYLNTVIGAVETCIFGGEAYWLKKTETYLPMFVLPVHRKFMGDGMLYLWSLGDVPRSNVPGFATRLCNRLWDLKARFKKVNRACAAGPVTNFPPRIRFGVARGSISALTCGNQAEKEYIGVCINLASRLQHYCPEIGFVGSARLDLRDLVLERHGYKRVVAKKIKGFPKEVVIVDRQEYERLKPDVRQALFQGR
jgi:class 3 adenylate cyclase